MGPESDSDSFYEQTIGVFEPLEDQAAAPLTTDAEQAPLAAQVPERHRLDLVIDADVYDGIAARAAKRGMSIEEFAAAALTSWYRRPN